MRDVQRCRSRHLVVCLCSQPNSAVREERRTVVESSPSRQLHQSPWITTNTSSDTDRMARLFGVIPRRMFANPCVAVSNLRDDINPKLAIIMETLNSNKDMLADGQASILQMIAGISTGMTACDLSGLEGGQTQIIADIMNLATDLDQLDDILAAITTAKDMIIAGQGDINSNIADLDSDLDTVKTMVVDGQADINTNMDSVSTELGTAKTMILAGQGEITDDIDTVSSELSTAKDMILAAIADVDSDVAGISTQINTAQTMILAGQDTINNNIDDVSTQVTDGGTAILAELTTVNTKLDTLEAGQQEICDKIEALETKIDTILDILIEECPEGATLNNGQCYTVSSTRATFAEAMTVCQTAGGNLATMTADNAAFLYGLMDTQPTGGSWIGLTMTSGSWAWTDGSAYGAYTDWPGAEPSNAIKQCVRAMATSSTTGEWEDRRCSRTRTYICQTAAT